jgi:WD40 repeat protein/serine/threonine protein kinase/tetratricopeptide (TPR) repeat protein
MSSAKEASIFNAARKIESQADRDAYLSEACGEDAALRRRVELLLASYAEESQFLERPAVELEATYIGNAAENNRARSLEAGLAAAFGDNAAVVIGDADHSVLKSLGLTIDLPRVVLREPAAKQEDPVARPGSPEMPKSKSDSRYDLQGEIARGGMGAVIKGRDTDLGRDLAIKVLLDQHKDKPEVVQRFVEEAQIGGQLQHPGIAPIYDLGQLADKRPFFSMKLVKGKTLSKLLAQRENPAEDRGRFLGIFEQICQTMAYAHSRGVIHRDLKPTNIMVGSFGEVQVMDWGLAKVMPAGGIADEKQARDRQPGQSVIQTLRSRVGGDAPGTVGSLGSQTQMGSVLGTPAYMPPEQALGEIDNLDERSDVFGLGAILCEILTGKPPYVGADGTAVFRMASRGKLDDCLARLDDCGADEELIALAKQCLAAEPADRPRDAGVLAERVTAYLESVETKLREAELARAAEAARVVELHRRRKLLYAIAAMLLVGLVTAGFAANHFRNLERAQSKLTQEKADLATSNRKLADDKEVERAAAEAARGREAERRREADAAREAALAAQKETQAARELAEARSEELRRTLYASEMDRALATLDRPGGAVARKDFLDHWRPEEGEDDLRGWEWYYLRSSLERAELVLDHPAGVTAVDWSRDGKRFFTGCRDGVIRVWDVETGRLVESHVGHEKAIRGGGLKLSPDGERLASIDMLGVLKVRNLSTGTVTLALTTSGHWGMGMPLAWSPDGSRIATSLEGGSSQNPHAVLGIIDADTGEVTDRLETAGYCKGLAWHDDGDRLAMTTANSKTALIWDLGSDERWKTFGEHGIDWDSNGHIVFGAQFHIGVFDPAHGPRRIWYQPALGDRPKNMTFSPARDRLAYVSFDREIRVVEADSRKVSVVLTGHTGDVYDLCWSPDGQRILTAADDGSARIWRTEPRAGFDRELPGNSQVAWRPGGSELAVGGRHSVAILRYPSYESVGAFKSEDARILAWTSDGSRLVVSRGYPTSGWAVLDRNNGFAPVQAEVHPEGGSDRRFGELAPEPGGDRLLVNWSVNEGCGVYSLESGSLVRRWQRGGYLQPAAWHPRGRRVAIADDTSIVVEDVETGENLEEWRTTSGNVSALDWHPSGAVLATVGVRDHLVELWELPGAQRIGEIGGGSRVIRQLKWSPDGQLLAIGSDDGSVRLWDRETGQLAISLQEDSKIVDLDWDESGTRLAIMTLSGLKVRDAAAGYLAEGSPRALPSLDERILAEPDRALPGVQRAELLEKLGRWEEAAAEWGALRERRPNDPWCAEQQLVASLQSLEPKAAIEQLEARLTENPDDAVAAKLLGRRLLAEAGPDDWKLLEVQEAVSEGGAFLLPQPDGSLLAAGDNPDGDVYRVTGTTRLSRISAVRLETIPDDRLPGKGSGRTNKGGFHLGDLALEAQRTDRHAIAKKPAFATAWADFSNPPYPVSKAIDGNPDEGWEPWPQQHERHTVVFELAEVFDPAAVDLLTVRLRTGTRGGHFPKHNLGRFRLAVTARPHAARLAETAHTLEQQPDAYDPWTLLGIVRSIRDEPEEAAEAFGRALDDAADAEPRRVRILAEAARDEAVFRILLQARPEDSAVLAKQAQSLVAAGEHDKAASLLSSALALEPDSRLLHWERGRAHAAARRWKQAAEDLSKGLAPDHPRAEDFAFRAGVFEKSGQWTEAVADWKRALKRKPGDDSLETSLVNALLGAGNWAEAAETAQRRFESAPHDSINWLRLATALVLSEDDSGYAAFREKMTEIVGDRPSLYVCDRASKSCLLLPPPPGLLDRLPVARMRELVGEDHDGPSSSFYYGCLALAELRAGALPEAEAHTVKALEKQRNSEPDCLNLAVRSMAQARQGKLEEARRSLEEATRILGSASNPRIHDHLIADILRREAEALLDQKQATSETPPNESKDAEAKSPGAK